MIRRRWVLASCICLTALCCSRRPAVEARDTTQVSRESAKAQGSSGIRPVCDASAFKRLLTIDTAHALRDSLPTSFERAPGGFVTTAYYVKDTLRVLDRLGLGETESARRTYYLLTANSYELIERTYKFARPVSAEGPTVIKDSLSHTLVVCNGAPAPESNWTTTTADSENVWLRELVGRLSRRSNLSQ